MKRVILVLVGVLLLAKAEAFGQAFGDTISVVSSADGRAEVFFQAIDPQGGIYHAWQLQSDPKSPWSPWERFQPVPDKANEVVSARDHSGRLHVGWLSSGSIWVVNQAAANGNFGVPNRIPSRNLRSLTLAINQDGRLEFFALSDQGVAWSVRQASSGSSAWITRYMGGTKLLSLAPTAYRDGRLALVALGSDHRVYWTAQTMPNGDWFDWTGLQGESISAIAAAPNADGRLDVVAIGGDGNMWERSQANVNQDGLGGWSDWKYIAAGPFQYPIRLGRNADGRLEAFAKNSGNRVVHIWQDVPNGSWRGGPHVLDVAGAGTIAITTLSNGRLALVAADSYIVQNKHKGRANFAIQTEPNSGWTIGPSPPELFPTPPTVEITSLVRSADYVDPGTKVTISWSLAPKGNCTPANLSLTKKLSGEPDVLVYEKTNPSSSGSKEVAPTGSLNAGFVYYVLRVSCKDIPGSLVSKETYVHLVPKPPAPTAYVVINGPFTNPKSLRERQPFSVMYVFENVGGAASDSFDVQLYVNDAVQADSKTVPKLDPGKNVTVQWNVTTELTGFIHRLEIRDGNKSLGLELIAVYP